MGRGLDSRVKPDYDMAVVFSYFVVSLVKDMIDSERSEEAGGGGVTLYLSDTPPQTLRPDVSGLRVALKALVTVKINTQ